MSVLKTLRERVAPELNHLYLVPPAETPAGLDFGWRGREHALHAFFVARMFGADAQLCTGDFAVISRFMPGLTSMGRDEGHAWCAINGVAPVDLSVSFQHYGAVPQLRTAIVGDGRNGDWNVTYAEDDAVLDENIKDASEILFIEKEVHEHDAAALLANPQLFLLPPPTLAVGEGGDWRARHGAAIYAQISLHCFECANGRAKSLRPRLSAPEAVAWIGMNYPDADAKISARLGG